MGCLCFCKNDIHPDRKECGFTKEWAPREPSDSEEEQEKVPTSIFDKSYKNIIDEIIRPKFKYAPLKTRRGKTRKVSQSSNRKTKTKLSADDLRRTTIFEEPVMEQLCERAEIEPAQLLFNVMTQAERRQLVEQCGANQNTAKIFESRNTLSEFFIACQSDSAESMTDYNTLRESRYSVRRSMRKSRPVSVSRNSVAARNAKDRWEELRTRLRESRRAVNPNSAILRPVDEDRCSTKDGTQLPCSNEVAQLLYRTSITKSPLTRSSVHKSQTGDITEHSRSQQTNQSKESKYS